MNILGVLIKHRNLKDEMSRKEAKEMIKTKGIFNKYHIITASLSKCQKKKKKVFIANQKTRHNKSQMV